MLVSLPFSCQSQSPSPYFDQSLYRFDEKVWFKNYWFPPLCLCYKIPSTCFLMACCGCSLWLALWQAKKWLKANHQTNQLVLLFSLPKLLLCNLWLCHLKRFYHGDLHVFDSLLQLISASDRHRQSTDHPIKFILRRQPCSLKFKIRLGICLYLVVALKNKMS